MLFPSGFRSINRFYDCCAKRLGRLIAKRRGSCGERFRAPIAMRVASVTLGSSRSAIELHAGCFRDDSRFGEGVERRFSFLVSRQRPGKNLSGPGHRQRQRARETGSRDAKISRVQIFPGE